MGISSPLGGGGGRDWREVNEEVGGRWRESGGRVEKERKKGGVRERGVKQGGGSNARLGGGAKIESMIPYYVALPVIE